MPNPSQVCKDGDAFANEEAAVAEGLLRVRNQLLAAAGLLDCESCGQQIPAERREALPSARTCVECQQGKESLH